jgi:hypothetical protein
MDKINHDDEEIREQLVPYALQQLDAGERAAVEHALAQDAGLRRELGELEQGRALLLEQMPRVQAPASVKAGVMSAVRSSGSTRTNDAVVAAPVPSDFRSAMRRARHRWFGGPALSGALAAACLLLAVVAVGLDRELSAANVRVQQLERATTDDAATVPAALAGAEPHTVLTTHEFSTATGTLIRVSEDKWLLAFNDVPEPAEGRSWQVWTAHESGVVQNVAQWHEGGESQLLVLDSDDIIEVMVSYEPSTEPAPEPTGEPVADVRV